MYEPPITELTTWSTTVFQYAYDLSLHHQTPIPENLGIWGAGLASWMVHQFQTEYAQFTRDGVTDVHMERLRSISEHIIWDETLDAERSDMFQGENVFNFGDYIWAVPILNADTPIRIFEHSLLLDSITKIIFLAVARGILKDQETNLVSQYLTRDLEARGQSRRSFDDRKGYDSFRLLFFFYYHGDVLQPTDEVPVEWILAAWRDFHEVRAMSSPLKN